MVETVGGFFYDAIEVTMIQHDVSCELQKSRSSPIIRKSILWYQVGKVAFRNDS